MIDCYLQEYNELNGTSYAYEDIYGVIYRACNIMNGKYYIGCTTKGLLYRKNQHERDSKRSTHKYFHAGLSSGRKISSKGNVFIWEIITISFSKEEMFYKEKEWIKITKANNKKYGYNKTIGGDGIIGYEITDKQRETSRQNGKNNKGRKPTVFCLERAVEAAHKRKGEKRRPRTEQEKFNISIAKIGTGCHPKTEAWILQRRKKIPQKYEEEICYLYKNKKMSLKDIYFYLIKKYSDIMVNEQQCCYNLRKILIENNVKMNKSWELMLIKRNIKEV